MDLRFAWAVLLTAVVAIGAAAIVLSGGSDEADDDGAAAASPTVPGTIVTVPTLSPTPTLGIAPDVTPTPVPAAEEQARNLTLVEAPAGLLQYVTAGPYVVPGDALGLFFLNVETQAVVGWHHLVDGTVPVAASGDNRFTVFKRTEQVFQGGTIYPAGTYLADRETRKVYRWEGEVEVVLEEMSFPIGEIATRGDVVLFRVPVEAGDDWFSLLDVAGGDVVTTFQAEAEWGVISEDASKIALAGHENIYVFDAVSGQVEPIAAGVIDSIDLEGDVELMNSRDGESFLALTRPAKLRFRGVSLRYTWEGDLLSRVEGVKIFPSPGGDFVASAEPILIETEQPAVSISWFYFRAFDTGDGSELFRVVGVQTDYGFTAGNRWLADGSGIVVSRTGGGLVLAMRDGGFRDFAGVPSPDSADVFAMVQGTGAGVFDAQGEPIIAVNFQGGVRDFTDPWGDGGDEVRILVPHGGHGGPGRVASIVEPYVEQAPYDERTPSLQLGEVAVAFGLVDLYDEPAGMVIGQVAAPYRVTVHEVALRCSNDSPSALSDCPIIDSNLQAAFYALVSGSETPDVPLTGRWARVTTPDGQEGWLLVEVAVQGI